VNRKNIGLWVILFLLPSLCCIGLTGVIMPATLPFVIAMMVGATTAGLICRLSATRDDSLSEVWARWIGWITSFALWANVALHLWLLYVIKGISR